MNERILELYKQAHVPDTAIDPSNNMHYQTTTFSAEKFAELIIQECVNITDSLSSLYPRTDVSFDVGYTMGTTRATNMIKKHFGVE
jgi:hypothetical protein